MNAPESNVRKQENMATGISADLKRMRLESSKFSFSSSFSLDAEFESEASSDKRVRMSENGRFFSKATTPSFNDV